MENNKRLNIDFEKISVYIAGLVVVVTLWTGLFQLHKDLADIRERIAILETKIERIDTLKK